MKPLIKCANRCAYGLLLVILTSCLASPHTTARSPKVIGRVLDGHTHVPIPFATIFFTDQPQIACESDANGYFILKETRNFHLGSIPPEGEWPRREYYWAKITISHTNYTSRQINTDSVNKGEIFLEPAK